MNRSTKIITVRHGKTAFNLETRYAGSIDVPLNEIGIRDSEKAALLLRNYDFDIVITSELKRAIHTAEILTSGRNIQIIRNKLCNERNYGLMQGFTYSEVENIKPPILYLKLSNDYHSLNPPYGETFPALRRRAKAFAKTMFENFSGSRILIVSSSAFMQQLHGIFRGMNWRESLRDEIPNLGCISWAFNGSKLIKEISLKLT